MNNAMQNLAAEALFVSDVQPSDRPTGPGLEFAVNAMIRCYGCAGCADEVAAEFGDHPEAAARRMCWARTELACLASWAPERLLASSR